MSELDPVHPNSEGDSTRLLVCRGVSKRFRLRGQRVWVEAVREVGIEIKRGECVALVGESGSGKSTLARILLMLERPDSGQIWLNGCRVDAMKGRDLRTERLKIQPVFQDASASFNPRRMVGPTLEQALALNQGVGREQLVDLSIELLESVGLRPGTEFLNRYPHQLSGGQKQRLAIARALAPRPLLLIGDEPLSGADVSIRAQILNLLSRLRKEFGIAYLLITHDILLAASFAERVYVMQKGEIVESGPAGDVLQSPAHEYTRSLIRATPRLPGGEVVPQFGS